MMATLKYKQYSGSVEVSIEDGCLFGRVLNIEDVISFEGQSVSELKSEFEAAVDEYLTHCKSVGKNPDRPYSGTFNVRVGPDRHRWMVQYGTEANLNINEVVCSGVDLLRSRVASGQQIATQMIAHVSGSQTQSVSAGHAAGEARSYSTSAPYAARKSH